jgi:hypothetical protein
MFYSICLQELKYMCFWCLFDTHNNSNTINPVALIVFSLFVFSLVNFSGDTSFSNYLLELNQA